VEFCVVQEKRLDMIDNDKTINIRMIRLDLQNIPSIPLPGEYDRSETCSE